MEPVYFRVYGVKLNLTPGPFPKRKGRIRLGRG
jgi:hypothetical protein